MKALEHLLRGEVIRLENGRWLAAVSRQEVEGMEETISNGWVTLLAPTVRFQGESYALSLEGLAVAGYGRFLSTEEMVTRSGKSEFVVKRAIQKKDLRGQKVGNSHLVHEGDFEAWLEKLPMPQKAPLKLLDTKATARKLKVSAYQLRDSMTERLFFGIRVNKRRGTGSVAITPQAVKFLREFVIDHKKEVQE